MKKHSPHVNGHTFPVNGHSGEAIQATPDAIERRYEAPSAFERYIREVKQTKLLTLAEERALVRTFRRGTPAQRAAAFEHLVKANLLLVIKIAREYEHLGVPFLDLINEGNLGLMKGIEKYRPNKGAKISTYVSLWIKHMIKRALSHYSKTVRIPVRQIDLLRRINFMKNEFHIQMGRDPTDEEIADELDIRTETVAFLRRISQRIIPLDEPITQDGLATYSDIIPDPTSNNASEDMEMSDMKGVIHSCLQKLSERERSIIIKRFGLDEKLPRTLEELGSEYRLTRERVRQIQKNALRRLYKIIESRDIACRVKIVRHHLVRMGNFSKKH